MKSQTLFFSGAYCAILRDLWQNHHHTSSSYPRSQCALHTALSKPAPGAFSLPLLSPAAPLLSRTSTARAFLKSQGEIPPLSHSPSMFNGLTLLSPATPAYLIAIGSTSFLDAASAALSIQLDSENDEEIGSESEQAHTESDQQEEGKENERGDASAHDTESQDSGAVAEPETVEESQDEDQEEGESIQDNIEEDFLDTHTKPNQPPSKVIEFQKHSNKTLHFQDRWYKMHPWLHYNENTRGILCFYCVKAYTVQKSTLSKRADPAFSSKGFTNWKNATLRFNRHEQCQRHLHAVTVCAQRGHEVNILLSSAEAKRQEEARHCLENIVASIVYLARQGLAIRGHNLKDGNLIQLLKFRGKSDACLSRWLSQCQDYTSPQVQNEVLQLLGNTIVREIANCINSLPVVQYSLIVDGTQDISGSEQESICLRFVDHDLVPHEVFVGLYQVPGTTGAEIAKAAIDVLQRLSIPLSSLRGQTYDGAANMSGKYAGVQAELKKVQPLGLFVHCGTHCLNLITESACQASPLIRDALQWVHELGTLSKQSGKFKLLFSTTAECAQGPNVSLRPLCPTRWTVRGKAITAVLTQYESVLSSLEQMPSSNLKANGLLERFQKGKTVLGLLLALEVVDDLECLNKSLQKRTETIAGMRAAVGCVRSNLAAKRNERKFKEIFDKATKDVKDLGLEDIQIPHQRKAPKR
ncbi:hypothetical protein WMY93_019006 [Mugilogobius chulae]|uniref:TTF-type domain-containing protein n=1 Tax=Mugilogobius chulae TaxID=88201 RepID=A0AAW0NE40_9GOBI